MKQSTDFADLIRKAGTQEMSNDEGMTKIECQICVNLCNLRTISSVISASSVVKNNFAA